ncbi:MAG: ferrous iron transport protein B [Victivallaceae bacterium]|nr:ferrous iron transport protein B [Victivallaceae bacterium]
MTKKYEIVLAGNPNSGKTSVFNALTGARQHVGNYPGVTVEQIVGSFKTGDCEIEVTDLPGTYSLTANSPEELIARNVIITEKPEVVVNIVDASNLERNLFLTLQFMELGVPMILVLNMIDNASDKGIKIDTERLGRLFGTRVVCTVGNRSEGINELKKIIGEVVREKDKHLSEKVTYSDELMLPILELSKILTDNNSIPEGYKADWLAIKLLEKDKEIIELFESLESGKEVLKKADVLIEKLENDVDEPSEIIVTEHRYGFISGTCREVVSATLQKRRDISEAIDSVVTHRIFGIPLFLGLMYVVFYLTFTIGDPFMNWIEAGFGWLGDFISSWWSAGSESSLKSLLVDGIIAGVGGVLVFLPNIAFLFLAIAILEGTGYMARVAFIMDRLMNKIGLHGKSFIPMLIGFGCSVPAIMSTRTLTLKRDRMTTMLVVPLMSCGARIPIYALIIPAFFAKRWEALVMFSIYIIGIITAIICAKLLRSTLFKGENEPFVMELPPYRIPTLKSVGIHMWGRTVVYLQKAGTLILAASVILWIMANYPKKDKLEKDYRVEIAKIEQSQLTTKQKELKIRDIKNEEMAERLSYTITGRIGHAIEPALKPMGFDWKIGTALIGAFPAKELFVSQMGIVFALGEIDEENPVALRDELPRHYNGLQAYCIMLFCLLSAPCIATIAITRRESNSWFWALFQLVGLTVLAYIVTTIVYQVGLLVQAF